MKIKEISTIFLVYNNEKLVLISPFFYKLSYEENIERIHKSIDILQHKDNIKIIKKTFELTDQNLLCYLPIV